MTQAGAARRHPLPLPPTGGDDAEGVGRRGEWGPPASAPPPPAWQTAASALAAALLGMAVIAYTYGLQVLPPWRTGWMLAGTIGPDPVQYWLGYTFFRQAPWSWPPGLSPRWGIEIASSVFYSDSIPLLAFLFKALQPLVVVEQYWGMWLYACGALQALMGWKLAGLATANPVARLAAAALFALSPTMLNRLGGHFALGAHVLLLAGLWLCLTQAAPRKRFAQWLALVGAASLIHSYLLPMVAGLWAADWLARAAARGRSWRALAAEAPLVPGTGVLGLYLAGFFALDGDFGGTWGGYGAMQLDLLAPFDAPPWGALLPDLPGPDHWEVGHSYAGLGALLALAIGAALWLRRPWPWLGRRWALLLGCAGMLAVAISHHVSIAGREFVLFELPPRVQALADALRASERFAWPAAYAALFAAIFAILRALGGRRGGALLALLAVIQFADMQPGFARLHGYFPPERAVVPLRLADPFWTEAATRYDRIRLTPTGMQPRHWEEIAVYAATRGLETDAVYLARVDLDRAAALNAETLSRLAARRLEPRSFYALGDEATLAAARAGMDPARDLLARFDGVWVLAPGWHAGE